MNTCNGEQESHWAALSPYMELCILRTHKFQISKIQMYLRGGEGLQEMVKAREAWHAAVQGS